MVWAMAENICDTYLVRDIVHNYAGAYFGNPDPNRRQIHVRRMGWPDSNFEYFDHPVWIADSRILTFEICTLTHEIAHAENHLIHSARWQDYKRALTAWMDNGTKRNVIPPPRFTDWDRGRIYEEESIAESRSREIIAAVMPEVLPECDARIYENLNNYIHILWLGEYPNGGKYVWSEDRYKNPVGYK